MNHLEILVFLGRIRENFQAGIVSDDSGLKVFANSSGIAPSTFRFAPACGLSAPAASRFQLPARKSLSTLLNWLAASARSIVSCLIITASAPVPKRRLAKATSGASYEFWQRLAPCGAGK
jgi:hypothetical protein